MSDHSLSSLRLALAAFQGLGLFFIWSISVPCISLPVMPLIPADFNLESHLANVRYAPGNGGAPAVFMAGPGLVQIKGRYVLIGIKLEMTQQSPGLAKGVFHICLVLSQ